jgi:hypothetical protein
MFSERDLDPVFCLQNLDRFEPFGTITSTMTSDDPTPRYSLEASMRSTGSAVSKGYGKWVSYDDVLRLMIVVKSGVPGGK